MNTLPKEQRDRLLLTAILTLAALAGLWLSVVSPISTRIERYEKQIAGQQRKLSDAEKLVRNKAVIEEHFRAATAELRTIEETMAAGDMYAWMIETVNKFRTGYPVEIAEFGREAPVETGFANFPYKAVKFNLHGTARFHDLGKFIADFENTYRYMRLQNLELTPASPGPGTTAAAPELLDVKMEIVTLINPHPL
jgi:Tfp pilus assembly protein PilO